MALTPTQAKDLATALKSAFPRVSELAQMVRFGLGENLADISAGENLRTLVFELITWAEAHDRVPALLAAAREANPDNPELRAVAAALATERGQLQEATGRIEPETTHTPTSIRRNNPSNIPAAVGSFIGRERDTADVLAHLDDTRLLTLTGPGGVGKTALALHIARRVVGDFPQGVYHVDLAPLLQPELIMAEIAHTLDLEEQGSKRIDVVLREYLRGKTILLVLDNFEYSPDATSVLHTLLKAVPTLKLLVTSTSSTHLVAVEYLFEVQPLALPPSPPTLPDFSAPPALTLEQLAEFSAVRLFNVLAGKRMKDFQFNAENAPAVVEICRRLDGLPLAIELVVGYIRTLNPTKLLTRLSSVVKSPSYGIDNELPRHQTLEAVMDWTHNQLSDKERLIFRRLAVFKGGSTLEAIEAICNAEDISEPDVVPCVKTLQDKSLLNVRGGDNKDKERRFWMLETILAYAGDRLAQSDEAAVFARKHAVYMLGWAKDAQEGLKGPAQGQWLVQMADEYANVQGALVWSLGDANDNHLERLEIGLQIAAAYLNFWNIRGYYTEGRASLGQLLKRTDAAMAITEPGRTQAGFKGAWIAALNAAGRLAWRQGDIESAQKYYQQSLDMSQEPEDKSGRAPALHGAGQVAQDLGHDAEAAKQFNESLALYQELGDPWGEARLLNNLGTLAHEHEEYARAHALFKQSLALREQLDDSRGIALSRSSLAELAYDKGDYVTARVYAREALTRRRALGDRLGITNSLILSAGLAAKLADPISRQQGLSPASGAAERGSDNIGAAATTAARRAASLLGAVYALLERMGTVEKAGVALTGDDVLFPDMLLERIGTVLEGIERRIYKEADEATRKLLHNEMFQFQSSLQEGRNWTNAEAVEYALASLQEESTS